MSVRLTKHLREAFVRAVIADIPQVDYRQEARDLVHAIAIQQLPKKVRAVYDDEKLREYLVDEWFSLGRDYSLGAVQIPGTGDPVLTAPTRRRLESLDKKHRQQQQTLVELHHKLTGIISSCSTVKQAKERFPELAKYLPDDVAKTSNLPATLVIKDLKSAGWPKDAINEQTPKP